jgi:hypothetical protein
MALAFFLSSLRSQILRVQSSVEVKLYKIELNVYKKHQYLKYKILYQNLLKAYFHIICIRKYEYCLPQKKYEYCYFL